METEINHAEHSMLRELIVEHLFIGGALRRFWQSNITDVEILRSEVDSFGYDLVMSRGAVVRHIQLKAGKSDGSRSAVNVSLSLSEKPSGCVIWILVSPQLEFESFFWFGRAPGERLPDIRGKPVAKHAKGTSDGTKNSRPNHRILKRADFEKLPSFDAVLEKLFGGFLD